MLWGRAGDRLPVLWNTSCLVRRSMRRLFGPFEESLGVNPGIIALIFSQWERCRGNI